MELHWLGVRELNEGYQSRQFSPVEVVQALLDRIEATNGRLHAFLTVEADHALAQAKLAEAAWAKGQPLGPLHGVPYGVKDLLDVKGQTTTCHSKRMLQHTAQQDAVTLQHLERAGAIRLGKLALHEFAIGGPAFDLPFPPARNPWNLAHHPGGSSSGSGSAVAAGLVPLAIGTDTGGSVRNPAGACGVSGLKPTYELVSRQGVYPLAFTLDHVGPLARSVEDNAYMLDGLVGTSMSGIGGEDGSSSTVQSPLQGLRIGFVRHFHEKDMQASDDTVAALNAAAAQFEALGARVVDVQLPSLETFNDPQKIILWSEGWSVHSKGLIEHPEDYCATSRRKLLPGAFLSAGDYIHALQKRQVLIRAVDDVLQEVDVLLVANSMEPPCLIDDEVDVARTYMRQARSPFNLTGHPALALPCGFSQTGLPLSMQLVGRWHEDARVLNVGRAFESVTTWHQQHPTL